jgi:hypothetical protein
MSQASCDELSVDQSIVDIHIRQYSFVSVWPASGWDDTNLFAEHELLVVTLGFFGKRLTIFWGVHTKITDRFPIAQLDSVTVEYRSDLGSMGRSRGEE